MSQKDIFLKSEGDAWFSRNQQTLADQKLPEDDPLLSEIIEIHNQSGGSTLKERKTTRNTACKRQERKD